jgi:hypothetical protein
MTLAACSELISSASAQGDHPAAVDDGHPVAEPLASSM